MNNKTAKLTHFNPDRSIILPPRLARAVAYTSGKAVTPATLLPFLSIKSAIMHRNTTVQNHNSVNVSLRFNLMMVGQDPRLKNFLTNILHPIEQEQHRHLRNCREQELRNTDDSTQPYFYLRDPDMKILESGITQAHDHTLLSYFAEDVLNFEGSTRDPKSKRLLNKASALIRGGHIYSNKTQSRALVTPRLSTLFCSPIEGLHKVLSVQDQAGLEIIQNTLLVNWTLPTKPYPRESISQKNPWPEIIQQEINRRLHYTYPYIQDKQLITPEWDVFLDTVFNLDDDISRCLGENLVDLPTVLGGTILSFYADPADVDVIASAHAGHRVAEWAVCEKVQIIADALEATQRSRLDNEMITMLHKLADGPLHFRALIRKYSRQSKAIHEPVLYKLQGAGFVELGLNGLIQLTEEGRKAA